MTVNSPKTEIEKILDHSQPSRFVYSPNYWQWFKHQQDHGLLPAEISHCRTLLDLYTYLGVDIFSRNIYSDPEAYWFGGICEERIDNFDIVRKSSLSEKDKLTTIDYLHPDGNLREKLEYMYNESTLVQQEFLVPDYSAGYEKLKTFVKNRRWEFNREKYTRICQLVGEKGVVIAGEFFSPLKMLHFTMNPINSVYFLMEFPEPAGEILRLHEKAMLECMKVCVESGVRVVMSMDNLDTMFHPPDYVKEYSSSYYQKASELCHSHGARFFIHACGQQKSNLGLISSLGVDGLEGVAFPPLGDVSLTEAMESSGEDFIITGGISAMETRDLKTREEVFNYVKALFEAMRPYRHRFIFSSSCNTAIDAKWETLKHFRDAWLEYRDI